MISNQRQGPTIQAAAPFRLFRLSNYSTPEEYDSGARKIILVT